MAKTTTTFTKSVKAKVPYHFVCNYCGKRNDKVQEFEGAGISTLRGSHSSASFGMEMKLDTEARDDLVKRIKFADSKIKDYGEGLKQGRMFSYSLDSTLKGEHPDHLNGLVVHDATCTYCGKKQAWSIDPAEGTTNLGCLILFIALSLMGLGILLGALGSIVGAVLFISAVGVFALNYILPKRKLKANQAKIAAEPNDPDKLPVLDLDGEEKFDHDAAPDEQLDSPAKITVIRESALYLSGIKPLFRLNNTDVGRLSNGESVTCTTLQKHNTLYAIDDSIGNSFKPFVFEMTSGGEAKIVFKAGKFLPDKSTGIKPL